MIEMLLRLEGALLDEYPNLHAYVARGEARPAFKRASIEVMPLKTLEGYAAGWRKASE
jgi:glutathione S-transferase